MTRSVEHTLPKRLSLVLAILILMLAEFVAVRVWVRRPALQLERGVICVTTGDHIACRCEEPRK